MKMKYRVKEIKMVDGGKVFYPQKCIFGIWHNFPDYDSVTFFSKPVYKTNLAAAMGYITNVTRKRIIKIHDYAAYTGPDYYKDKM